jgi:hypothetical protein
MVVLKTLVWRGAKETERIRGIQGVGRFSMSDIKYGSLHVEG